MAYQTNPNDPLSGRITDDDEFRRNSRIDNDLQVDPELAEGPASSGRIAMFAVAIAVLLGVVFYGLNNTPLHQAATSTAQNSEPATPPGVPPGMRDVTPRANTGQGMTTGAAPASPRASANPGAPPAPAPSGTTN